MSGSSPAIGLVDGLIEALRVCRIAAVRGRVVVPHCWKTGLGIAAAAHLAAATGHCPYIEFLPVEPADSPLRRELVLKDLRVVDGQLALPMRPRFGIERNRDALQKYRVGDREWD
jgi:L-alanine-DL-glutamate epimerase-like enolase superfamily enzyme